MRKYDLNVHVFQNRKQRSAKSDRRLFSNFELQRAFSQKRF